MTMKILHFLEGVRLKDGGVARAVLDNCAVIAERGHQVILATKDDTDVPEQWKRSSDFDNNSAFPVIVVLRDPGPTSWIGRLRTRLSSADMARMQKLLNKADVLHVHGPWEPDNTRLARAAHRSGTPYIVTPHGMLDDWCMSQRGLKKRLALKVYASRTLAEAALVQCTASGEVEQARKWIGHDRIQIIPCVMVLSPYQTLPPRTEVRRLIDEPEDGIPLVLYLSRIHYKKQPEVLLRAIALLATRGQSCRLNIAGTGEASYLDSLKRLANTLGIQNQVRWMGMVTGEKKIAAYCAATVYALPTSQENFGLVYPESLACGTPVIATKGVDIWPELESSGGAIIAPATPEAFADAIGSLLRDPDRALTMGESGRQWVFQALDGRNTADRIIDLYEQASSSARN